MPKPTSNTTLKRLRNRYRLVVMNDDTYEEVVTFKLSRLSVYIGMSTIFVLLIALTVALLSFTNLKYLIPGYGKQGSLTALRELKVRTDSLDQVLLLKQQYLDGITKVLKGDVLPIPLDTSVLILPKVDTIHQ
ncbi:MAG: hypothetical protein ABIX01_23415 [Chitinophagaceae bacterium]